MSLRAKARSKAQAWAWHGMGCVWLALSAWVTPLAAQIAQPPLSMGAPAAAIEPFVSVVPEKPRGFLWEARRGKARVVLYGTIHFGLPAFWPPTPSQLARFAEIDVVSLEADPTDTRKSVAALQAAAMYAEGQPGLDKRLSPELLSRVEQQLQKVGLDPQRMWRMRPWMLAQTLVAVQAMRAGLSPAYSAEAFLSGMAQTKGRRIDEIEGIDRQLHFFDRLDDAAQQQMLAQTLDQFDSGQAREEMRALVQSWVQRDAEAMERRIERLRASSSVSDAFMVQTLLDGRHPAMLAHIERAANGPALHLVAVGALHYFGPNGLLEMMRSRGWTIAGIE